VSKLAIKGVQHIMTEMKPIIVFGTGRSGTTVFHQMLSEHPQLTWLSELINKFPNKPILNKMLMKSFEFPYLENILRKKIYPGECYQFWDRYSPGFSEPCRDLDANDVSLKMKKKTLLAMNQITTDKRNRLLLKVTGWPRLGFLSTVFDDAKFIHITRDGRAVANSLVNVGFWRGWAGPEKWRWGNLSPAYLKEWHDHDQSFIVLAAIQWKILMDAANNATKHIEKSRLMEVKYEQLCDDPIPLLKQVADFCEIDWSSSFETKLHKYQLRNTNTKYQQELNKIQQQQLNEVLAEHLKKYGYE
jgi:hypothetical protein